MLNIKEVSKLIEGKKTYITAGLMVLFGVLGLVLQQLSPDEAIQIILVGLGFAGVRHGLEKK